MTPPFPPLPHPLPAPPSSRSPRAFATIYALILLSLVAAALALLGHALTSQLRHTQHTQVEAQLRALLRHAADLALATPQAPTPPTLPPDLASSGYTLTITQPSPPTPTTLTLTLTAAHPTARLTQSLTLTRASPTTPWHPTATTLDANADANAPTLLYASRTVTP